MAQLVLRRSIMPQAGLNQTEQRDGGWPRGAMLLSGAGPRAAPQQRRLGGLPRARGPLDPYADAEAWLEQRDGLRIVTELDGRRVVVVSVAGRSAQAVVDWSSEVAERAAFVKAIQALADRL